MCCPFVHSEAASGKRHLGRRVSLEPVRFVPQRAGSKHDMRGPGDY